MSSILIRRVDETLKARLRIRAAVHGRSMEEEAREILRNSLTQQPSGKRNLAEAIRRYVEPFGGAEIKLPKRKPIRRPPDFRA